MKDVKIKGAEDILQLHKDNEEFWKGQSKYLKQQNEKFLEMHSKLVETIQTQTKDRFIDNTIRAKNTDWSKKENNAKKNKKPPF